MEEPGMQEYCIFTQIVVFNVVVTFSLFIAFFLLPFSSSLVNNFSTWKCNKGSKDDQNQHYLAEKSIETYL